ncbi:annexin B10-like [Ochlerotatus camptorhynchus]|uniref:annexin B10-like n=1 Tax=Ochlerotatus camptorhynchus TaxID=644619 RepID=UPI0031D2498F
MPLKYTPRPTILPAVDFDASADATALRAAMKGFGTDEQTIISILCARSNSQRQTIATKFNEELGRDLLNDLKSELSGNLGNLIRGLMLPPMNYLCDQLFKAMDGFGTNECTLIEILCSQESQQLQLIAKLYEEMFNRPLVEHVCSETSGDFRRLLTLLLTTTRDPPRSVDRHLVEQQAKLLYEAGEGKWGTEESTFSKILTKSGFEHLELLFEEYKKLTDRAIEQALKAELSGKYYEALSAIVEYVRSPARFFARRLYEAMRGLGTDDAALIRIIVSRAEIDLENIKEEFERMYGKTLANAVKSETSGDYERTLCELIEKKNNLKSILSK